MQGKSRFYNWATGKVRSRFAPLWLGIFFLLELVLFLPLDAILILFCLENPSKRYTYATIATLTSTCTGIIGYALGIFLWDHIGTFVLEHLVSPSFFARLEAHYLQYQSWAVMLGSFLPIPFKAVTLSAGFCHISFGLFLLAILAGRALRFFSLSQAIGRWGDKIKGFIERHFNQLATALGAKVALTIIFFWILGRI